MRWSLVLPLLLVAGAIGCGGGYPEPTSPVVEEEESSAPPPTSGPDDDPTHEDDEQDDDVKPKGDPTDDIGDPRDQKHDEESLPAAPRPAPSLATRRS